MSDSSKDLDHLIELMAKLPGLGPRSARRAVLHMVKKRALLMAPLADVLAEVAVTVRECLELRQYRHCRYLRHLPKSQTREW